MSSTVQPVLLSLKPVYANMVFERSKTVEFRRRVASYMKNRDVFIYVTSPAMELRGGFRIGKVWHGSLKNVWSIVHKRAGIDKRDFDTYFEGRSIANALEITDMWECHSPISLAVLRREFPNFVIPRSWRYVRDAELPFFQQLKCEAEGSVQKREAAPDDHCLNAINLTIPNVTRRE